MLLMYDRFQSSCYSTSFSFGVVSPEFWHYL